MRSFVQQCLNGRKNHSALCPVLHYSLGSWNWSLERLVEMRKHSVVLRDCLPLASHLTVTLLGPSSKRLLCAEKVHLLLSCRASIYCNYDEYIIARHFAIRVCREWPCRVMQKRRLPILVQTKQKLMRDSTLVRMTDPLPRLLSFLFIHSD